MKRLSTLSLILFLSSILIAQEKSKKWDVNDPPGDWGWKEVKFSTDEGTWMSVDVSPDGKTIAFDMLGDIYTLPIEGGNSKPIRQGVAWEVQPRFSPDGSKISFTSDAGGGDNIWTMNTDGSDAKQITKESFRLLNNAEWMPDGNYLVARKHFTSSRSLGAGELWMYHITGGNGYQLTKKKNEQQDVNEPTISPDGNSIYYSEDMYPGGFFQYNKDPNSQIYAIKKYDIEKGKTESVLGGPGGAFRPQVSPDGKQLAYLKRVRTKTVLGVYDIASGKEHFLFDNLSKDQQEAWAIFGVYSGFDWTPDGRFIVISGMGKIWKVDVSNGKAVEIPFQAEVSMKVAETIKFQNEVYKNEFNAKVIRHAITSPDGKKLLFNAVGHLYMLDLPNGKPTRLTNDADFESEPAFAPDGKSIVYVTWDDEKLGKVVKMDLATKVKTTLSKEKGIYRTPQFSNDGQKVVFKKDGGNMHQGFVYTKNPGIYLTKSTGTISPKKLSDNGSFPIFSKDDKRIYYQTGGYIFGSLTKSYESVNLNGEDKKEHFSGKHAQRYVLSPDNNWIAWSELYKVYIAPFPKTGKKIGITKDTKSVPVAQVAKDAGINIHWSSDSKTLHWTLGNQLFSDDLTERFKFLNGSLDSLPPMDSVGIKINLKLTSDKPEGKIAFINARIITMENDEVIENGTVIIDGNRIDEIGSSVSIPNGVKTIDLEGKTIMPGIIDAHAHSGNFRYGLSPKKQWEYYANLAYGVTTSHDPSTNSEMVFANAEMIKAGKMVGPRLFSTGTILYGAEGDFKAVINSLEDAKSALRRTKAYGAFSVKSYNQPRRDQRQQVIQAARELDIIVVPEGGSFFNHNLNMVVDGHTGVEHNIPVVPLFNDVTTMWSHTKAHNTPTLVVNYGSVSGEYYWYQKTNVWEKDRLLSFTPRPIVDSRARHRTMIPDEEYENGHILTSQSLKKLSDKGVRINLGAHGQLQGLGAHWELWMIQQGGMSTLEALKAATINGAIYLGMDHQIGSLKKGKLADLIVLENNPLENIRNTEQVVYTMINGRLYDASTMNEIGNYSKTRSKFYFEQEGSGNAYPYFIETGSHMMPQCCLRN
jgi:imidazolonepropionase-like amidohydrolase/Tol biopolymer transport system component